MYCCAVAGSHDPGRCTDLLKASQENRSSAVMWALLVMAEAVKPFFWMLALLWKQATQQVLVLVELDLSPPLGRCLPLVELQGLEQAVAGQVQGWLPKYLAASGCCQSPDLLPLGD